MWRRGSTPSECCGATVFGMPGWIGPWELLILLFVVLLVFGPKRLPEAGRSLGKGMREFKNSITGNDDTDSSGELEAETESLAEDPRAEQVAEELRVERRERLVEQAQHEGRFGADEADNYRKLYDADRETAEKVIEKLPVRASSTVSPLSDG
jgi:sec-independent protein translocase protein TatA